MFISPWKYCGYSLEVPQQFFLFLHENVYFFMKILWIFTRSVSTTFLISPWKCLFLHENIVDIHWKCFNNFSYFSMKMFISPWKYCGYSLEVPQQFVLFLHENVYFSMKILWIFTRSASTIFLISPWKHDVGTRALGILKSESVQPMMMTSSLSPFPKKKKYVYITFHEN